MRWIMFTEWVENRWHDLMGYTLCRWRGHLWRDRMPGRLCRRCHVFSSR